MLDFFSLFVWSQVRFLNALDDDEYHHKSSFFFNLVFSSEFYRLQLCFFVTDFLATFCAVFPGRRYVSCKKWADSYSLEGYCISMSWILYFFELNFVFAAGTSFYISPQLHPSVSLHRDMNWLWDWDASSSLNTFELLEKATWTTSDTFSISWFN